MSSHDDAVPTPESDAPLDPKEAMRQALERKKEASQHLHAAGTDKGSKVSGNAHGPQGGGRMFRRKSGS